MNWIRSFIFNIVYWGSAVVIMLVYFIPALCKDKYAWESFKWIGRMTLFWTRVILGITYEVKGKENIPNEPVLVACKHQSVWECGAMLCIFPGYAMIFKKELMSIPIYKTLLTKTKMISVDREAGKRALIETVRAVKKSYENNQPVLIFPEGTRSAPGVRSTYKRGISAFYEAAKVPVLPVALNSGLVWPRREFCKKPGHITVEILPPIPQGLDRNAFMQELEDKLESASLRLAEQGAVKHA